MENFWVSIGNFVYRLGTGMREFKVIDWVSIATMAGVFLGPYLAVKYNQRQRRKNQHLKEIHDKVLQPLKERIDRDYLPTLEKKIVNIQVDTRSGPTKFITHEDYKKVDRRVKPIFTILEPKEASMRHGTVEPLGKLPLFVPDSKFYSCVKEKHFPSSIERYEQFKQKFDAYNEGCLQIAEAVKEKIKNQIDLPSYDDIANTYVAEYDLALFILKKSLQESYSETLDEGKNGLSIARKTVVQTEDPQKIKECIEKTKELVEQVQQEKRIKELAKRTDALIPEVKDLRDELDRLLKQKRLPGKCEYT